MANRICRRCGKEYEGAQCSSLCPVCVTVWRANSGNIKTRICRTCGSPFPGGTRAYYCPDCRAERKREAERRSRERKAAGKTRAIGSEDICTICGRPYTVASGLQQFCNECARKKRNADALAKYYADPDRIERRKELRDAGNPTIECIICGKQFVKSGSWITCSRECSRAHAEQLKRKWEDEHKEQMAAKNKDWYRRYFESLSPEELEQFKVRKREEARNRYHAAKTKEN